MFSQVSSSGTNTINNVKYQKKGEAPESTRIQKAMGSLSLQKASTESLEAAKKASKIIHKNNIAKGNEGGKTITFLHSKTTGKATLTTENKKNREAEEGSEAKNQDALYQNAPKFQEWMLKKGLCATKVSGENK